jgi:hypothetical protein
MKTGRFCPHCGQPLLKSRTKGYSFQCLSCDEDFYKIEVLRKRDLKKVKALRRDHPVPMYNQWWYSADFITMEIVTGYRQSDFDPEEGYQAFVDACEDWWKQVSQKEKIQIWKEYIEYDNFLSSE